MAATPEGYGGDAKAVWFHNSTYPSAWGVKGADPATFVSVGFNYARDAKAVYYEQRRVAGAVPRSFRVIGATAYAADEASVYYEGRKLAGADPATFRVLEADFVRDRSGYSVYGPYAGRLREGAVGKGGGVGAASGRGPERGFRRGVR